MRQGQQNKRMRGRGRNKAQSSLNRVFESNGPDVKIRGPASHIAEKYMNLARDAQASGDPISAENYLQHAEHYFRIISSAQTQAQQQAQQQQPQQHQGQPQAEQPASEMNGAPQSQPDTSTVTAEKEPGNQAGAEPQAQASDEQPARKPRRRRSGDGKARATNGSGAEAETQAEASGGGDAQDSGEDGEPGVEEPAESAA